VTDCRSKMRVPSLAPVKWGLALLVLAVACGPQAARARPPLNDSFGLNIGLNCRWERRCMVAQERAMKRALAYVHSRRPSAARIHLCNRNATRGRFRIDWIGFDNCIRNASLKRR
jgi:hypothetical protein